MEEHNSVINLSEINSNKIKDSGINIANNVENIVETPIFYDIIRVIFRYLIIAFIIGIALYYIPNKKPELNELMMILFVTISIFAILELYMPEYILSSKLGFGFSTESNFIPKII